MIIPVTSRKFDAITRATVVPNSVTKDEKECSGCGCCEGTHTYIRVKKTRPSRCLDTSIHMAHFRLRLFDM
jgi:hypothetical protein